MTSNPSSTPGTVPPRAPHRYARTLSAVSAACAPGRDGGTPPPAPLVAIITLRLHLSLDGSARRCYVHVACPPDTTVSTQVAELDMRSLSRLAATYLGRMLLVISVGAVSVLGLQPAASAAGTPP